MKPTDKYRPATIAQNDWSKMTDKELYTLQYYGATAAIRKRARRLLLSRSTKAAA